MFRLEGINEKLNQKLEDAEDALESKVRLLSMRELELADAESRLTVTKSDLYTSEVGPEKHQC